MALEAAAGVLACPHCGTALAIGPDAAACSDGHSFDRSRQGYLNLLGGPQPANADNAEMLAARGRVLDSGLFDRVLQLVGTHARGPRVVEVGSGTAHYLAAALGDDPERRGVAVDISVAAGRIASRRDERIAAVVADAWRGLPLLDDSVDTVLSVFAPRNPAEFARVLAPSGRVLVLAPESGHLARLRRTHGLLGIEPDKAQRLLATMAEFFDCTFTDRLLVGRPAAGALISDLIAMGPNAHHHRPGEEPGDDHVQLDVVLRVFEPLGSPSGWGTMTP
jgi:23S rRNA (guanine745-N1)-methyltransferase